MAGRSIQSWSLIPKTREAPSLPHPEIIFCRHTGLAPIRRLARPVSPQSSPAAFSPLATGDGYGDTPPRYRHRLPGNESEAVSAYPRRVPAQRNNPAAGQYQPPSALHPTRLCRCHNAHFHESGHCGDDPHPEIASNPDSPEGNYGVPAQTESAGCHGQRDKLARRIHTESGRQDAWPSGWNRPVYQAVPQGRNLPPPGPVAGWSVSFQRRVRDTAVQNR
eukprot:TRINITY_DN1423_c0_g7_i1.p2 TRINITY_DN1423_c0_g7~~TRINITY_DN1423_c0_g7_i1.p2  ORF type:complete len:220 (+),score=-11.47 TRINITY_DN1423_c0_g7_i1:321-980(+)